MLRTGIGAPDERGAALVIALMIAALLAAIASSLIAITITETMISGGYRSVHEAAYAADAGIERAVHELGAMASWTAILSTPANEVAAFSDADPAPKAPDGRPLDLARLTVERQTDSDAAYGRFNADAPRWCLFAHASLRDIVDGSLLTPPAYVLVWVADDPGDGDADPGHDSNGQILLYADAFGVSGARRGIEVSVARAAGGVRLVSWKETR